MKYRDIANLPEDERIQQIVTRLKSFPKQTIGFFTDSEPGKAERYIEKIKKLAPGIVVLCTIKDIVPGTVFVKMTVGD